MGEGELKFAIPKIVPDEEQAAVWKKVRLFFEKTLESVEKSPVYDDEALKRTREVLAAIDECDWSRAYEYLEREINQLEAYCNVVRENETAKEIGTFESTRAEIEKLTELRDSLRLQEK